MPPAKEKKKKNPPTQEEGVVFAQVLHTYQIGMSLSRGWSDETK
jgi:hypothetical protein